MQAENIENARILRALQKLNLKHDAPCYVSSETILCTLKIKGTHAYNYEAVRIQAEGIPDTLLIDDGKRIAYRFQCDQILRLTTLGYIQDLLKRAGLSD